METRADIALDVRSQKPAHDRVYGLPASTVAGHHHVRGDDIQCLDGARDDLLEEPAGQVHAADECVHVLRHREPPGMFERGV